MFIKLCAEFNVGSTWLNQEKFIQTGNYYKTFHVYQEEIPITTLSEQRFQFLLFSAQFDELLTDTQKLTRDIFIFGCSVALRFSDIMLLKIANIERRNDHSYLKTKSKKTGISAFVKLPEYALTIINRYSGRAKLFPDISLAHFNKCLKKIGELAEWNEPILKNRSKRGGGEKASNPIPFHESMSSHMMRRTSITSMLTAGIPEYIVRSISGHTNSSKSFYRYVNLAQNIMDTEINKLHKRLYHP